MIKSFFFGLVQGLTEFLPVSSSGHLFILKKLFGFTQGLLPFFVLLHFATLCSVLVFLHKQILRACRDRQIILGVISATAVTVALALTFDLFLGRMMDSKYLICAGYLLTSVLLLSIRRGGERAMGQLSLKEYFLIGIIQGLAVVPGISRSGITITALLRRGLKKEEAFNFSFLLAIPVILGALLYELKDFEPVFPPAALALGFAAAFLSGLLALKMLKKYLGTEKLYRFGYYCLMLSLAVLFL